MAAVDTAVRVSLIPTVGVYRGDPFTLDRCGL
jgi:hypothetical protein